LINYGFDVSLDTISAEHAERLREWRNNPKVRNWCRQVGLISQLDQEKWIKAQNDDPIIRMFVIEHFGEIVGVCGLTSIDQQNRRAEFSLYIAPDRMARGISTLALKTLCKFGFLELGLNIIWGESFDGNHAIKVFEKIGFKFEGTRRDFYFKNGKFLDAHLYSLKASELIE